MKWLKVIGVALILTLTISACYVDSNMLSDDFTNYNVASDNVCAEYCPSVTFWPSEGTVIVSSAITGFIIGGLSFHLIRRHSKK